MGNRTRQIWEFIYAVRRDAQHGGIRAEKMTQSEFLQWSDEAVRKRDECLSGKLSFEWGIK